MCSDRCEPLKSQRIDLFNICDGRVGSVSFYKQLQCVGLAESCSSIVYSSDFG